ncbi:hypothetical protein K437DRAFT_86488 [Tilletiaria anomala UBC 951]|uniref:Zn(2)-C6 fungal-type domain-containing protein n=1 Tax=Tilletiaria anomala (strain ATCC 24038 / CBS 436.72 / UBC 951) TaxID=1037660 RepID=A0A066W425_TILAU|nr:uncharacterized protein K437DRAFT_86488 [Tilletiaria anomala UBC 951]KDN48471.1 hypothetical protein K437DRAFT_86488 [Tilletiaria anomala UBC 951]
MDNEGTPAPPWIDEEAESGAEDGVSLSSNGSRDEDGGPPPNHRPGPGGDPVPLDNTSGKAGTKKRKNPSSGNDGLTDTPPPGPSNANGADNQSQSKRKRVYRACEVCRRKKVRCNGEKPCQHCVTYNEKCHYFEAKDRSAYSKRYVESLETRLGRLEQALNQAIAGGLQSAAHLMTGVATAPHDIGSSSTSPSAVITAPEKTCFSGKPSPHSSYPNDPKSLSRETIDAATELVTEEAHDRLKELAELSIAAQRQTKGLGGPNAGQEPDATGRPQGGTVDGATAAKGGHVAVDIEAGDEARSSISGHQQSGRLQYDENRNLRYIGPSATVTLVLDAHSALDGRRESQVTGEVGAAQANLGWITSSLGVNLSRVLPSVESVTFPERDLSDLLVRTFFDCIHPLFPVLDERDFNSRYSEMFNQAQASESAQKANPLFVATLFAIYACASRVVQDPRVCPSGAEAHLWGYDRKPASAAARGKPGASSRKEARVNFALAGVQFFARSQLLALHRSMETRIEQVQTNALLAYFMASSNCAARAWLIIGQALRMACDLGLHRNLTHLGLSYLELEVRKRVWWNIYILDRILSVSLGRPLGIEDASIDQEMPSLEFQPPFPLVEGFCAIIRLVRLSSDIAKNSFQRQHAKSKRDKAAVELHDRQAKQFVDDLDTWFNCVPAHLKTGAHEVGSAPAQQSCIAFILYRSATMLLQRLFLQGGLVSASRNSVDRTKEEEEALSQCYKTAHTLIKAAPRIAASLPASPFLLEYAQQVLVAGGYLALNAWRWRGTGAAETHLQEANQACLALHGLEPIFPSARALRRVLESVIAKLRSKLGPVRPEHQMARGSFGAQGSAASAVSAGPSERQDGRDRSRSFGASATQSPIHGAAPFNTESWMVMLNASVDYFNDLSPATSFDPAQGVPFPGSQANDVPKPSGGLDFEGLEWLETMFGGDASDTLRNAAGMSTSTQDMSAPLWES